MAVTQPGMDVGAMLSRATSRPPPTPVPAAPDTAGTSDQGADQGADQLLKAAQAAMAKFQEGAPKPEATSPEQTWGSMAMAVAALGGLLTHAPITTAANAMAGVLNATKQGDQARAQKEFEQWQVSHEAAGKMVDYTLKLYDDALKLHSPQARLATIRALDAQFKLDEDRAFLQQAGGDHIAAAKMRSQALHRVRASSRAAGQQITETHEQAAQAQNDQQAIAEGLGSDDPNKQADALDRYANAIDKSQVGKGSTANTRMEGLTVGVRLRALATELRSDDPTRIAAARTAAASIGQIGSAVLKAPRTPTPGSSATIQGKVEDIQAAITADRADHPDISATERNRRDADIRAGRDPDQPKTPTPGSSAAIQSNVETDIRAAHSDWTPGQVSTAAKKIVSEAGQPTISDEAAKIAVDVAFVTGHPPAWMGRSSASLTKFLDAYAVEAKAKGLDGPAIAAKIAKFTGELAESRSLGTISARIDFGARELDVALPQAAELSAAVYRQGFRTFAQIEQALQGLSNDPELAEFSQQNQAVINAYSQIMQRGGMTTVDSRDRAESLLRTATSQATYMRQLDRLHKEVQTILYGSREAKQALMNEISGGTKEVAQPVLTGVPVPKPSSMTDDQILAAAKKRIAAKPAQKGAVLEQLRAWGIDAGGL